MQQPPEGNYQSPSQPYPPQPFSGYPPQQPYPPRYTPPPGYPPQQPGYPPQLPPLPPKKKPGKGWFIGLGAVILAFFVCIAASHGSSSSSTTTATNTSNTTQSQSTQAPTVAPKPQIWTTVQSFKGNGEQKTAVFSVPDDWKVNWTCNPSSFMGNSYNLIITVYNSDGTLSDLAINTMCQSGTTSGTTEEHQAGNVYLDISSEGDWSVTIQELK